MTTPIKLFTLYAQLQGGQLISGNLRIPVTNFCDYKEGITGYFVIEDMRPGFMIVNYIA